MISFNIVASANMLIPSIPSYYKNTPTIWMSTLRGARMVSSQHIQLQYHTLTSVLAIVSLLITWTTRHFHTPLQWCLSLVVHSVQQIQVCQDMGPSSNHQHTFKFPHPWTLWYRLSVFIVCMNSHMHPSLQKEMQEFALTLLRADFLVSCSCFHQSRHKTFPSVQTKHKSL